MSSQRLCQWVCSASDSSQRQEKKSGHTPFLTSKQDKKSHGVPNGPKATMDVDKSERDYMQPIQATTLILN